MLLAVILLVALVSAQVAGAAVPDIHAHRGGTVENGKARFAEESVRAYNRAARHGFVFEVDAKLTEDGVPVAIHDATLDRLGTASVTVRFNARVLPELEGPERVLPRMPDFQSLSRP